MSTLLKLPHSSVCDENIPNNDQYSVSASQGFRPEDQGISQRIYKQTSTETMETFNVNKTVEQEKEDAAVGSFSPVYSGSVFDDALSFRDEECGEPLPSQHLRIDFAPIEGQDDNEYIVKKCQDFWTMIEQHPVIHGLQATPEMYSHTVVKSTSSKNTESDKEPTATKWVERNQVLVSEAFTTDNQMRYCDDYPSEICSDWMLKKEKKKNHELERIGASVAAHTSRSLGRKSLINANSSVTLTDATVLCRQLEEWDMAHPKSMEPPGHPPKLSNAVMLRDKSLL